jgi:hypothetical protein
MDGSGITSTGQGADGTLAGPRIRAAFLAHSYSSWVGSMEPPTAATHAHAFPAYADAARLGVRRMPPGYRMDREA